MSTTKVVGTLLLLAAKTSAFTVMNPLSTSIQHGQRKAAFALQAFNSDVEHEAGFDPLGYLEAENREMSTAPEAKSAVASAAFLAALTSFPIVSNAAGPDWGLFEGRSASLLHPLAMGSLFVLQLSTALKGFKWRRQRELGDEISALKKQIPSLPDGASSLQAAIEQGKAEGTDVSAYTAALSIESQVADLTAERKELSTQNNRDSHFQQGALLAAIGTAFAIEGPLNTYARAGKLFPGPHLYAGAGLVVCWALAAGCVPYMQKGNDTARSLHIAANAIGLGLFAWQVQSGIPIVFKVIEFTKWP